MLNDPFARLEGPLAGATRMRLEVVENRLLTPSMQQVVLTAPELAGFGYRPGQDIMLMVAVDGDRPVRRRYTIRDTDPARCRLTLGIVRHDGGPGERWVATVQPGDEVEGIGRAARSSRPLVPPGTCSPGTSPRCPRSSPWPDPCPRMSPPR
jgi:NADPH-dependent ferric siderophore reductase